MKNNYDGVEVGNILKVTHGVIAHGCNAQGVMGSGIAASIKITYPKAYNEYVKAHNEQGLKLGDIIFVEVSEGLYIANCITQFNYGKDPSIRYVKYSAVKECAEKLASFCAETNLDLHYPLIGAGLAHGEWSIISSIIDDAWERKGRTRKTLWVLD